MAGLINPNPQFNAGLAQALMPGTNFAQRRADAAANLQLVQMDQQQAAHEADQKRDALAQVQNTLAAVDSASLLDPDMRRLNESLSEPFRQRVETELRDQYGGDVARYQRERGDFMAKQFAKQLIAHPLYTQATRNMTNYALAQDAINKGKLVVGDFDKNRADFEQGRTPVLNFQGAYDPPKDVWDYFDKTHHSKGQYGQYLGMSGGREQYQAYEVTQSDLRDRLLSEGLSPVQADDYVRRLNYTGGRTWKIDKQSPWDAAEQTQNANFRQQSLGIQQQELGLRKQAMQDESEDRVLNREYKRAQMNKLNADAQGGTSTNINTQVFNPATRRPVQVGGKTFMYQGQPVTAAPGVKGDVGEALAKTVGLASAVPVAVKIYDKDKKEDVIVPGKINSSLIVAKDRYGNKVANRTGAPLQFQSVDTGTIFYYPDDKKRPVGFNGSVPHIRAIAIVNDKEQEVMLPIEYNQLITGNLAKMAGIGDSDEKRAQMEMPSYLTPSPTPNRPTQAQINAFNEMIK